MRKNYNSLLLFTNEIALSSKINGSSCVNMCNVHHLLNTLSAAEEKSTVKIETIH